MRITNTNGNSANKINGSRVTIYNADGSICDRFEVPAMCQTAESYCRKHPSGVYGKRFTAALNDVK